MKAIDKPRETFESIQYVGTPVMVEKVQVGFAPVPEVPEVTIKALEDVGFSQNTIAILAYRMAGVDIRNKVAGKYNGKAKKELLASHALELIAAGTVDALEASEYAQEHKVDFTKACYELAGESTEPESLKSADANRWHFDVMKSVVK